MGATKVEAGTATRDYVNYLAQRAETAAASDSPDFDYTRYYLPGALALASVVTRSEGGHLSTASEIRASGSLLIARNHFIGARHYMREHLREDLDLGVSWEPMLQPAAFEVADELSPRLPGFMDLRELTREVVAHDERVELLAHTVMDSIQNRQQ